jgi:tryptophanyl-tRNA synthetase
MRVLTGVQSSGVPHLGNILGAIDPAIEMSKEHETFLFIANMHSITTFKDSKTISDNIYAGAATYLAHGFDTDKNFFYKQSDIPEVGELSFYLSCFFGYNRLKLAHSFKDKQESGTVDSASVGLFTYPMLMAADILLYDADIVPVGKDQKQHLEYTREVCKRINHAVGKKVFKLPTGVTQNHVQTVPGITRNEDGSFMKMSKSYDNTINLFQTDKKLRKQIMSIQTDSMGVDDSKDPDQCIVYKLYELVGSTDGVSQMREDYINGGVGYGHFKQRLFEQLLTKYGSVRENYSKIIGDREYIDNKLSEGADKVRPIARQKSEEVKKYLGL